ncbi:fatty acid desaturase [Pendulispora albinea]|uniref:Fatty acid desaturase n=1 Tax=Pendulispora albinea TaxID=2741071 RepID=A0ABZ2LZY6_9BACT
MLSTLRYCLVAYFFFPLIIAGTWVGGYWPLAYLLFAINMYVLVDNFTPPLTRIQTKREAPLNDLYLFLQVPLSALLLCIYLFKIRLMILGGAPLPGWAVLGFPLAPFSTIGETLAAGFAIGFHCGSNVVVAHEMMHRSSTFWRACSRTLLVMTGDAQFQEAHLYGHHSAVGTLADPATARRGEGFYRFLLRSTVGQWKEAYAFEQTRLRKEHGIAKWVKNRVLRGNAASLLLLGAVTWSCGLLGMTGYVIVMVITKAVLESVNYIQHYGLTREPGSKVEPQHSWECASRGSSMYLFNLTRHAQHHAVPRKPYWELEVQPTPYRLPHGYMLAIWIALIPRLWFRYADRLMNAAATRPPTTPTASSSSSSNVPAPDGTRILS